MTYTREAAQTKLGEIIAEVDGSMGVAAWPVGRRDEQIGVNANVLYPTASTFKIPILYSLYRQIDAGEISPYERIEITEELRVPGSGVLQYLQPGLAPTIIDLATLMTIVSDNEATDILHARVDPRRIHADLDELGLHRIRVPLDCKHIVYTLVGMDPANPEHTYEMFRERARAGEFDPDGLAWQDEEGSGNDLSPPDQMAALCETIELGVGLSDTSREAVLGIMKRQQFNERIPGGLPENVEVAHKTGSFKGVRNDAGIVYAEEPYVIAIFSKCLEDERAGVTAMQEVSRVIWNTWGDAGE